MKDRPLPLDPLVFLDDSSHFDEEIRFGGGGWVRIRRAPYELALQVLREAIAKMRDENAPPLATYEAEMEAVDRICEAVIVSWSLPEPPTLENIRRIPLRIRRAIAMKALHLTVIEFQEMFEVPPPPAPVLPRARRRGLPA